MCMSMVFLSEKKCAFKYCNPHITSTCCVKMRFVFCAFDTHVIIIRCHESRENKILARDWTQMLLLFSFWSSFITFVFHFVHLSAMFGLWANIKTVRLMGTKPRTTTLRTRPLTIRIYAFPIPPSIESPWACRPRPLSTAQRGKGGVGSITQSSSIAWPDGNKQRNTP